MTRLEALKVAKARADFKQRGGTIQQCQPGEAYGATNATFGHRMPKYSLRTVSLRIASHPVGEDGAPVPIQKLHSRRG